MKKIGLICLAVVLAVGVIGIGFASWTDTVVVEETVTTGSVCVGIRDVSTDDPGPHGTPGDPGSYLTGSLDPGWKDGAPFQYDKNVASCNSTNVTWKCEHNGTHFYVKVIETIDNAYPSYAPTITFEIANCGSIPVIITEIEEHHTVSSPLMYHVETAYYSLSGPASIPTPITGSGWVSMVNALLGIQIDPCEVLTVVMTKHILQNNPDGELCPQNVTCTWVETIHFTQWNSAVVIDFVP